LQPVRLGVAELKAGFCVCSNERKWTCASNKEWPQ